MSNKIVTPINMLIYETAATYAAIFYEAGRSSGMTSKYKTPEEYARVYLERFIPMVVKNFIEMLKPTSNCTHEMRAGIYEALMDPVNDPQLMDGTKNKDNVDAKELANIVRFYDKNQPKFKDLKLTPPTKYYKNVLLNTANPITPKPN